MLAVAGLVLLAPSLVDAAEPGQQPPAHGVVIWLAACGGGAVLLIAIPTRFTRAASLVLFSRPGGPLGQLDPAPVAQRVVETPHPSFSRLCRKPLIGKRSTLSSMLRPLPH